MSGFALMHRAALDHPLFKGDSARLGAWFWLVSRACWKPTPFNINGKMVTLDRGQVCVSIRTLADEWGWSKSSVDRFVTRLKTETMIETEAGQGRLIITICNYSKYQDRDEGERDSSGTPSGTAAGHERDIKEQGNKGTTEEREEPDGSSLSASDECEQVVSAFNRVALAHDLALCVKLTPKRRAACKARIRDHGFGPIIQAIEHIPKSAFLRGEAGNWKGTNIEFLLRPDTVTKILEGQYDDKPRNQTHDRQHSRHERSTTRETGERVAARYSAGGRGPADVVPLLGPPRRHE
jgi:hypothetical protein